MSGISIDGLEREIKQTLEAYADEVNVSLKKAVDDASKVALEDVKANAPRKTGKYAKSWKVMDDKRYRHGYHKVVWTPTYYTLVHLLEQGHALRDGGRSPAYPHVEPAEKKAVAKFENDLIRAIEKG